MQRQTGQRATLMFGSAIALTSLAELFYFLVWGMLLFPTGSLAGNTPSQVGAY